MGIPSEPAPRGREPAGTAGRRVGLPYVRSLDGLRGVAVAAVLLFHLEYAWAGGGHLGVSVFFTLSGFLITSLLLTEKASTGRIALGSFWARRARRLVPAIVVTFGLIAVAVRHLDARPRGLVGDSIASSLWVANWRFVFADRGYADLFSSPSPFQHFWSLAVEEQFYVVFPLLVVAVVGTRRGLRSSRVGLLALVLGGLVVASTAAVAALHSPVEPIARAYYGTDARAAELLVGALLAIAVRNRLHQPRPERVSAWSHAAGVAGLAGVIYSFVAVGEHDVRLYHGGLLLVALCSATLIYGALDERSLAGRLLSTEPLVGLGKISYGAYLFHWPLFLVITERTTGLDGATLDAVRISSTLTLAAISYAVVEAPIRYGTWLPSPVARPAWATAAVASIAVVAITSGEVAPPHAKAQEEVAAAAPAEPAPAAGAEQAPAEKAVDQEQAARVAAQGGAGQPAEPPPGKPLPPELYGDPGTTQVPPVPDAPPDAVRVAIVGDSLGLNIGDGLTAWAETRHDVVAYNLALPGCPISRDGIRRFGPDSDPFPVPSACGWWDDYDDRRAALEEFDPDVVVVQDSVNEMLDRWIEGWDDYYRPGHPRFDRWLRDEYLAAFGAMATSPETSIVVTNTPCGDWDRYEAFRHMSDPAGRVRALNTGVYQVLQHVTVADLFERICPNGEYRDEVEGVEDGRPDGIHLSDEAAEALARNWLGPIVFECGRAEPVPTNDPASRRCPTPISPDG